MVFVDVSPVTVLDAAAVVSTPAFSFLAHPTTPTTTIASTVTFGFFPLININALPPRPGSEKKTPSIAAHSSFAWTSQGKKRTANRVLDVKHAVPLADQLLHGLGRSL
jgi:hypothetical protein